MELKLYELFGTDTLRHRETARAVLDQILKNKNSEKIVLDFTGISFASRSFCHELKKGLNGKDAVFLNMLPEVDEMMRLAFSKPKIDLKLPIQLKKLEGFISS